MSRIEILTIGDELVDGRLVDTNACELSSKLADLGLRATGHRSIGDDETEIICALRTAAESADAVLVSGGLGPTGDDLTAAAAAAAFGLPIKRSAEALEHTRRFFSERGREMPPTNEKQADLPAGCVILPNPEGTAVGFSLDTASCRLYFMPGVPRELRRMADEAVLPDLAGRLPASPPHIATLKVFGIGESDVAQRLEGLGDAVLSDARLTVQYRATFPEIHIRLVVEANESATGREIVDALSNDARERLGRHVFAAGGPTLETSFSDVAAQSMIEAGLTMAAAEIASAGGLAQLLSSAEGGDRCFSGAVVAVDPQTMAGQLGLDSSTAERAAEKVREHMGSAIGVATYGSATGSAGQRAGTMNLAAVGPEGAVARELFFPLDADRFRRLAAHAALALALRTISRPARPGEQ
jgi:nicotinamide-nucleotide amidase